MMLEGSTTAVSGADALVRTLVDGGLKVCFANPGTSEMHFVSALDHEPDLRCVLGLFEGVVTGAADGYFRMTGTPAATLLHLGPGLANGIANLHNARKAGSGILNLVGDHASTHGMYNSPLASDLAGLARPISDWVRSTAGANAAAADGAMGLAVARGGRIATLLLPSDSMWNMADSPDEPTLPTVEEAVGTADAPASDHMAAAADMLRDGQETMLLLGGTALRADALAIAGQIARKTGAKVCTNFFNARMERGAGRFAVARIPYDVDEALAFLQPFKRIVAIEAPDPLAFFGYPGKPSLLRQPDSTFIALDAAGRGAAATLSELADRVGAGGETPLLQARAPDFEASPGASLTPETIAYAIGHALPEGAIVVDESLTTGRRSFALTAGARPHDWLQNRGGSIGFGTPVATGAAIGAPDRKVVCLVGDGSAMYTLQSLWTQARETLNVTTIVFANRAYQILKSEYAKVGAGPIGARALQMLNLDNPALSWVELAKGMGVEAVSVDTLSGFTAAMQTAFPRERPFLIEVVLG